MKKPKKNLKQKKNLVKNEWYDSYLTSGAYDSYADASNPQMFPYLNYDGKTHPFHLPNSMKVYDEKFATKASAASAGKNVKVQERAVAALQSDKSTIADDLLAAQYSLQSLKSLRASADYTLLGSKPALAIGNLQW